MPEAASHHREVLLRGEHVLTVAAALSQRLGMRRPQDVRVQYLALADALDELDAAIATTSTAIIDEDREAAEHLAAAVSAVAALIDVQARAFRGDRTHELVEQIAYRTHDGARRLHNLLGG